MFVAMITQRRLIAIYAFVSWRLGFFIAIQQVRALVTVVVEFSAVTFESLGVCLVYNVSTFAVPMAVLKAEEANTVLAVLAKALKTLEVELRIHSWMYVIRTSLFVEHLNRNYITFAKLLNGTWPDFAHIPDIVIVRNREFVVRSDWY